MKALTQTNGPQQAWVLTSQTLQLPAGVRTKVLLANTPMAEHRKHIFTTALWRKCPLASVWQH